MLTFIADRSIFEIEGLGPETAEVLARSGFITDMADLFEFCNDVSAAIERLGEDRAMTAVRKYRLGTAAVRQMIETTERAKTATWDRWIAALGIPMIGRQLGMTLAQEWKLTADGMITLPQTMLACEGTAIDGIGFHEKVSWPSTHWTSTPSGCPAACTPPVSGLPRSSR